MRYISQYQSLELIAVDGTVLHRFKNGSLIIGDPTLDTAGNAIPVTFTGTDSQKYTNLYSAGATDLEKIGLGNIFFEAPPIASPATNTIDDTGVWYQVLTGTVIYNGVTYKAGELFLSVDTFDDSTGTGTFALDVPHQFKLSPVEHNQRSEYYKTTQLAIGDESSWNEQNWESTVDSDLGAVR